MPIDTRRYFRMRKKQSKVCLGRRIEASCALSSADAAIRATLRLKRPSAIPIHAIGPLSHSRLISSCTQMHVKEKISALFPMFNGWYDWHNTAVQHRQNDRASVEVSERGASP
jgi:hypothetical protein